jgi:DNA-binding response OmpR family regulator
MAASPMIPAVEVADPEPINLDPLAFDAETGILSYRGKTCAIPFKTYQHAVCAKLFEHPGERVDEKDILTAVDLERDKADSERLVKDAVHAVNRKAKAELGITDALVWKKLTAWVNDEYAADFLGG